MRSPMDCIVTRDEVHGYANRWLGQALRLEYRGTRCNGNILLSVLLIAAARVVSIAAACRDLADAPTDQTIRNALNRSLPTIDELERRLNQALVTDLPRAVRRKSRMIAIDLTLIPYHGQPHQNVREIYRGQPKSGTTHFHAYATAVVVHKGYRYTLALTSVAYGEPLQDVARRLVRRIRQRHIKIKLLLLDKAFFSVSVISWLKQAGHAFIIPAVPRGRKPKPPRPFTGLRALLRNNQGYYRHTLSSNARSGENSTPVTICVASKSYLDKKQQKRKSKKLLFAVYGVRQTPPEIRELYRKRYGIETSYRQMNRARIRTSTRDPAQRLLFVGIALVLRNVWVWLHFRLAKAKWKPEPRIFPELLRFDEMLLWIYQKIERLLGGDQIPGISLQTYKRVTANC